MPSPSDTSLDAERFRIEGYRRMSPAEKLERVFSLNESLRELARARIRSDYGHIPEREAGGVAPGSGDDGEGVRVGS